MSNKTLQLKIVTPEKMIYDLAVDQVTLPTQDGIITLLPGHVALMTALSSGDIVAMHGGENIPFAVVGGFVEVKEGTVIVLADFAEHVGTIGDEEVAKAKARAEELQKQKANGEIVDFERFKSELERSLTRVKIADKWRNRKYRI